MLCGKQMMSRDHEKLGRVCNAILWLDESDAVFSQKFQTMTREVIEARRMSADWKALQLIMRDLMEWVHALPAEIRAQVQRLLIAEGVEDSAKVDDERISRVLRRRKIRTASKYKAVSSYLENVATSHGPPGVTKILSELTSNYLADGMEA
jgi:hypothetical protein